MTAGKLEQEDAVTFKEDDATLSRGQFWACRVKRPSARTKHLLAGQEELQGRNTTEFRGVENTGVQRDMWCRCGLEERKKKKHHSIRNCPSE